MTNPSELIRFLSRDYSVDEWSDDAIERAIELGHGISQDDWSTICAAWKDLSFTAQERLAEVARQTAAGNAQATKMFVGMLSSRCPDIVDVGLDSLCTASDLGTALPKPEIECALETVEPTSAIRALLLNELRRRIQ